MSTDDAWNDESRNRLRERLSSAVLGELRLARRNSEEILEYCREAASDECPDDDEYEAFVQFAEDELKRAVIRVASEKATWPEETDCDRLDIVESNLRERGIVLWQVSPCCDTCTCGELQDRIDVVDRRYPGFRSRLRGYAFFIDQNMPAMLAESTNLTVYLAYGSFSNDKSEVASDVYKDRALGIAREICGCLRDHRFKLDWDGRLTNKIGLSLNWQRRTMLD